MASVIKIEAWIHAITVMARVHGWFVQERDSRAQSPTHIILKGGSVLVVFARPSGGKLMAQHEEPYVRWEQVTTHNPEVQCVVATPESCDELWAVLTGKLPMGDLTNQKH